MLVFLGWIAWSILNAIIAKERGHSQTKMFWLSILLSPLLILVYILAVPPRVPDLPSRPHRETNEEFMTRVRRMADDEESARTRELAERLQRTERKAP